MFDFLSKRFASIFESFGKERRFTEDNLKDVMEKITDALLQADVPHALATTFVADLKKEVVGKKVLASLKPEEQFVKTVHDAIKRFLGGDQKEVSVKPPKRFMMVGLQGSGKTTSIAKLASFIKDAHPKTPILCASVDFYRPAAIDQLELLSSQVGVDFYRSDKKDIKDAVRDINAYAQAHRYTVVFLDTAGRLHVDQALMNELQEIKVLYQPDSSVLVLDGMTGQESLSVAEQFETSVGFDYAILSKMDSGARAGAVFSFRYALKKPIAFIGVGERPEDLERFSPERIAGRMLDMGDVVTLAEKAEKVIAKKEQEDLQRSMAKGRFSLEDFAKQMEMMGRLGSMTSVMKYLPGMGSLKLSDSDVARAEQELKMFKAIIGSMTKKERLLPDILDGSRKKRIARGAGVEVSSVNLLISRFQQSQQYVKLLSRFGKNQGFFK